MAMTAVVLLATCLALQALASVKLNDRMLCETCHAVGNDASRELLKEPGLKTDEEVRAFLDEVCSPDHLEGYSINPQVLAHACENLLEHHFDDVYQAFRNGWNEYELCHKALPVCEEIDYNRHGYTDPATLRNKLRKLFTLILDLTTEPNEEIQRRVPDYLIERSKLAAQQSKYWYEKNNKTDSLEDLQLQIHELSTSAHFLHHVYESIQKRKEFNQFLTYKINELQNIDDVKTDVDGGTVPLELKQAKQQFFSELKQASAWLNHPDNKERDQMDYATMLAKLRNDGIKIDLNNFNGYYDNLKQERLKKEGHKEL